MRGSDGNREGGANDDLTLATGIVKAVHGHVKEKKKLRVWRVEMKWDEDGEGND